MKTNDPEVAQVVLPPPGGGNIPPPSLEVTNSLFLLFMGQNAEEVTLPTCHIETLFLYLTNVVNLWEYFLVSL